MSDETTIEDLTGLKNKISELHGLLKQEKARADKAEREREEVADSASNANATELEKAVKRAEKAEQAFKDAETRAQTVEANLRNTRADNALNAALAAANIDGDFLPYLSKSLRGDITFTDAGEPLLNDKSVADYIKGFTAPKGEGHRFVRAPNNGGGAAVGYTGSKPTGMTRETWNASEWGKMAAEDPEQARAVAIACGKPDLAATL